MDLAEALRGYLGLGPATAPPDTGDYAAPLRPMLDPLAGRRSIGEMPSRQESLKAFGRSAVEPFGQLGQLMTGQSQDTLGDIVGAAAGLVPIGPPGAAKALGKIAKPAAEAAERIVGATYSAAGKHYVAPNHVLAMDKAVQELGLTGTADLVDLNGGFAGHHAANGFMTSTGRVVDRAEANRIADAAEQGKATRPGSLKSEDVVGGLDDFIKAYHGSPHDFERFDLSKIGTGEGAQAYGHGLYFAENEGTAKSYRDALTRDKDRILENGGRLPQWVAAKMQSRNPIAIDDVRKDFQARITEAEQEAKTSNQPWLYPEKIAGLKQVLQSIEDHASGVPLKTPGRMYEVAIKANPEHFLDWDKPLNQHSEQTQAALKEAMGSKRWEQFKAAGAGDALRRGFIQTGDKEAARALREAGIPGIKYLDQGSRGKAEGTRNYVVFDDKLIDILKKYGIAGIGALPAMNAYHYQDSK
jgi:hypothetical protein